jgi:crotonobetaine/carnitine-CoA ligase
MAFVCAQMNGMPGPDNVAAAEACVVRYALEAHAASRPGDIYAAFESGERWTFAETLDRVKATAAALAVVGVRQDDRVLLMLPNSAVAVEVLLAVNYLGAVFVPINTAYRGAILSHVVSDSNATVAVVNEACVERLLQVRGSALRCVVVAASDRQQVSREGMELVGLSALKQNNDAVRPLDRPIQPWDLQSIMYTSGTTGRSKGVLSSYMHSFTACNPQTWICTRPDDRHLLHMPIFHIGGAFIATTALCVGASIGVVPGFKTDTFWASVRTLGVTSVFLLGSMATFLLKQPPGPDDRRHGLRHVMIVPLGTSGPLFVERFGVPCFTLFNMTEISTPLMSGRNPAKANICGRPRPGVEVRLVDANDIPVAPGEVGELVVRTTAPWAMSHGYNANPSATAAAWRNGWFHTGDAFRVDEDGDYYFADRLKDMIRRRGENISSFELELELLAHPSVREAAAVAVPSEFSEDEVLAVLAPAPGCTIDPVEIIAFLRERLPPFMIPRFIRVMAELPKTPTAKVEKHVLRGEGSTPDTWDRDRAGVVVRRDVF